MSSGFVITNTKVFNPAFILTPSNVRANTVSADSVVSGTAVFTSPVTMSTATVATSGIVPNSTSVANSAYVDGKISALVNGAPAALDTLKELADAISSDGGFSGTIGAQLAAKANLTGGNTYSGTQVMSAITLGGVDVNTRITSVEGGVASSASAITSLSSRITTAESNVATLEADVGILEADLVAKASEIDSLEVRASALEVHDVIVDASLTSIDSRIAANTSTISANSSAIATNTSAIALRALDSNVVHTSGNESIGGIKTFASAPLINSNTVATNADISAAIAALVNSAPSTLDTLGEISTVLQNNTASVDTILSTMVTLGGAQSVSGVKTFAATPVLNAGLNVTGGAITLPTASVAVSALNNTSLPTLAGTNAFTGANTFSAQTTASRIAENVLPMTVTSNALSINWTTQTGAIISCAPSSGNNMALTVTNLPTTPANASYTMTFLINTGTNKQYFNTLSVNGTSITLRAAGGLTNVSINASAVYAMQSVSIVVLSNAVALAATSVTSLF